MLNCYSMLYGNNIWLFDPCGKKNSTQVEKHTMYKVVAVVQLSNLNLDLIRKK